MSLPGRGHGEIALIKELLKDVRYAGRIPGDTSLDPPGRVETFLTLITDQLAYPLTGLDANPTFYIREDAWYNLYFEVYQPSGNNAPATGFGTGWSGNGEGGAWIYTNRYGKEGKTTWTLEQSQVTSNLQVVGPLKRYLYYGDYVQFWTWGGATGHGVKDYDARAVITRLRS